EITAGPGIASFGGVVVLTMLASISFDPRLAWDATAPAAAPARPPSGPAISSSGWSAGG
ncbi:MAG TPA: paraquat-inducible protein A, partial [Lautropia sp.]|nr:paraquat-inducible protein A [Lautropia sp.]